MVAVATRGVAGWLLMCAVPTTFTRKVDRNDDGRRRRERKSCNNNRGIYIHNSTRTHPPLTNSQRQAQRATEQPGTFGQIKYWLNTCAPQVIVVKLSERERVCCARVPCIRFCTATTTTITTGGSASSRRRCRVTVTTPSPCTQAHTHSVHHTTIEHYHHQQHSTSAKSRAFCG